MSRRKVALIVLPAALILVLAVGLTRPTNDDTEEPSPDDIAGDIEPGDPWLQPVQETIEVSADADCRAAGEGDNVACQGFQIGDIEVAWMVEHDGEDAPVASFLRRTAPTSYDRVLQANGAADATTFERVNVRLDDLSGDGATEAIFGYHQDEQMSVDIVDSSGAVLAHIDLGDGQVKTGDGMLITWRRETDGWLREELVFTSGELEVTSSEHVPGPAEGNL